MNGSRIKKWLGILCLGGILLGAVWEAYIALLSPPAVPYFAQIVDIPRGTSLSHVAGLLHNSHLIRDKEAFVWMGRLSGAERKIISGEYALDTEMDASAILSKIVNGTVVQHAVTIPEGYSLIQVAGLLEEKRLINRQAFLHTARDQAFIQSLGLHVSSLEGYLFPDTYYFARPVNPKTVIQSFIRRLQETLTADLKHRAKDMGMPIHAVLTLASIIEKETANSDERNLISGVFHNRLRQNIPLQSDPTVVYALRAFDGNITKQDLRVNSPYNTYRVLGLPPGPIANPGKAAIEAALYPATTDFLYFVSRNNGSHKFSATLDEHNQAVQQYQVRLTGRSS
ncbi:MAG: endolytic transglycosylase MltG [Nitrospirales bacterium]|nr:endolytic transglycosylase MltG [Nitrospirales bacterium]